MANELYKKFKSKGYNEIFDDFNAGLDLATNTVEIYSGCCQYRRCIASLCRQEGENDEQFKKRVDERIILLRNIEGT